MKKSPDDIKIGFLHDRIKETLKDLLPMFKNCSGHLPNLEDFPVNSPKSDPHLPQHDNLQTPESISESVVKSTVSQVLLPPSLVISDYLEEADQAVSKKRSMKVFKCSLCGFNSNFKSVTVAHIRECWKRTLPQQVLGLVEGDQLDHPSTNWVSSDGDEETNVGSGSSEDQYFIEKLDDEGYFWNYKNSRVFN